MGMQDRDYYREWWKEKQGYVAKLKRTRNLGQVFRWDTVERNG